MFIEGTNIETKPFSEIINRKLLKQMTKETGVPGALYGIHFQLDKEKREQLILIQKVMQRDLERLKNSSQYRENWDKFEKIREEGFKKGALQSLTFPPIWLVNSGNENSTVRKIRIEEDGRDTAGVEVPPAIYSISYYSDIADHLEYPIFAKDDYLSGTSTSYLHKDLQAAGQYLYQRGFIEKESSSETVQDNS